MFGTVMPVGFAGVALKTITVTVFQKVTVNEGRRQGVFSAILSRALCLLVFVG